MRKIGRRLALVVGVVLVCAVVLDQLFPPPLEQFIAQRQAQLILAENGAPLRAFPDSRGVWRYAVQLEQISPQYMQVLLNYEDRWFFRHRGVNPISLSRAVAQAIYYRRPISGGSTITMQLARLIEPIPHSVGGKLWQMWRATQLELRLSKREILQLYVQFAPFGGTVEGVETAARAYLGKSSLALSDAEAALLAVLPQRPSALRPDRRAQRAQVARDKVLDRMLQLGVWSAQRVAEAKLEPVLARRLRSPMHAPLLAQRLHKADPAAVQITTSIDLELQQMAQARVQNYLRRFPDSSSAAVLIVENSSMLARAYIGSRDFFDSRSYGHIDMVQASRSPGSTLKPSLYGLALDAGLIHSESLLIDAPQDFAGYRPANFSEQFNGPISAASALRLSLNVPAVDLLDRVGPGRFYAALEHAGLKLQLPGAAAPNLSMILGGAGARLEELVAIHAALARSGQVAKVRLSASEPLSDRKLLSPGAAWIVYRMLAEAGRSNEGDSELFNRGGRGHIAFKTGTSYGFRDAWALGASPNLTIGVWIGRPDGTPSPGSYGAVSALPLLFELFDSITVARLGREPPAPDSVSKAEICWPLGTLASANPATLCHRKREALVLGQTIPPSFAPRTGDWQQPILEYYADEISGLRRNASCLTPGSTLKQIARWPALAYPWLSEPVRKQASLPPLAPGCSETKQVLHALVIEGIAANTTLKPPSNRVAADLPIGVRALGSDLRIDWLLDGVWVGQTTAAQAFRLNFPKPGRHRLLALDASGRYASVPFQIID